MIAHWFAGGARSSAWGWAVFVALLALQVGCVTVTLKRGPSPDAMTADERACRATAGTDDAAYLQCMGERGSLVLRSRAASDGATDEPPPVSPPWPGTESRVPRGGAPVGAGSDVARPAAPAALTPPATPPPPARATSAPRVVDPLTPIKVDSWWKLGGSPADLDRAIDQCVHQLGSAHRPDPGATVVTAGLRGCLRAANWYPLGGGPSR